jgi:hypothetical protein
MLVAWKQVPHGRVLQGIRCGSAPPTGVLAGAGIAGDWALARSVWSESTRRLSPLGSRKPVAGGRCARLHCGGYQRRRLKRCDAAGNGPTDLLLFHHCRISQDRGVKKQDDVREEGRAPRFSTVTHDAAPLTGVRAVAVSFCNVARNAVSRMNAPIVWPTITSVDADRAAKTDVRGDN